MLKAFALGLAAAVALLSAPCSAATVYMDISDQAGFSHIGVSGIFGNGVVYTSPKYFFDPGTTVDFGFATVQGDGVDHRSCTAMSIGLCTALSGSYLPLLLVNGETDWREGRDQGGGLPCMVSFEVGLCAPSVFRLLLTLGPDNDGVQLAFQGISLSIVPVPLPAALPMFAAGLGLIWYVRRRTIFKREAEAASQASGARQ